MQKKVFIFDFDGTLYSGYNKFALVEGHVKKHRREFLPRVSDADYKIIVKENPEWQTAVDGMDIVNMVYDLKKKYPHLDISVKDFWSWQNSEPDPILIDRDEVIDIEYIHSMCKAYPVYVVSNSSPTHIKYYMHIIGIDPDWFRGIKSNHFTAKDRTKQHYYIDILEKEGCEPQYAYVIGDSVANDLNPAKDIGINTIHVTSAVDIPALIDKVLQDE